MSMSHRDITRSISAHLTQLRGNEPALMKGFVHRFEIIWSSEKTIRPSRFRNRAATGGASAAHR
jgi:hypothetical protein